jgi:hypothetical protein
MDRSSGVRGANRARVVIYHPVTPTLRCNILWINALGGAATTLSSRSQESTTMEPDPFDPGTKSPVPDDLGNGDPAGWWDFIDGAWRWIVYPTPA